MSSFRPFALDELTARGIRCLALRRRGRTEMARLVALTAAAWRDVPITWRTGYYLRFRFPPR